MIRRETIGADGCPLFHRWTLVRLGTRKVMLHHFLPNGLERDEHDHPWGFLTLVLRGAYLDMGSTGREWLAAPCVRWRRAEHRHRTMTDARGAWTLVLVPGGKGREWGFWREGRWMPWRDYLELYDGDRC
jgi:hypothetical protein